MQSLLFTYNFNATHKRSGGMPCSVGVAGPRNCEVLVQENETRETVISINTSADGFEHLWEAVCDDFIDEYRPENLCFTINDNGATPAIVSLRLRQAIETFYTGWTRQGKDYVELCARDRIASLFDDFHEFTCKGGCYSPHLAELGIAGSHDDGIIIGRASFQGTPVFVAAQQREFIGGAVGEIHGAKLNALFMKATEEQPAAVILLVDSGGVRLQEANAGEIAISEIIRSVFEARKSGIRTIGVVCGKNGAYGGMGIISAALDCRIVSEISRMGVSGAEVIQSVMGKATFNARDHALVWRVYGGKTRYLQQEADYFTENTIDSIRKSIAMALEKGGELSLEKLEKRQALLERRFSEWMGCREEGEYLRKKYGEVEDLFGMHYDAFMHAAEPLRKQGGDSHEA